MFAYEAAGYAFLGKMKKSEAVEICTKGIAANPRSAGAYAARGRIFLSTEDPERAIRDYNKAIELSGSDAAELLAARAGAYLAAEPLRLRYAVYVHSGPAADQKDLIGAFKAFDALGR